MIFARIFLLVSFILIAIFFPFRRTDLTASALLQVIRSEGPRLHAQCLASAATSTREQIRFSVLFVLN